MKRWLFLFFFVLLFVGLVVFRGFEKSRVASRSDEPESLPVRVLEVTPRSFAETVRFVGSLDPEEQAAVVPKLEGRTVLEVPVQEGDRVQVGQLLAVLDDRLLRAALGQAEAAVDRARAVLDQAEAELATIRKDFHRMEKLLGEEVVSRQEFDHVQGRYEVALALRDAAYRGVIQAGEARKELQISLGYHRIQAPVAGVLVKRLIDPGDVSDTKGPAFVINRQDRVKIRGAVSENVFAGIVAGMAATVTVDALEGRQFEGRVERVSPVVDPATRTGMVEILMDSEGDLKPGMFARVRLELREREGLALPREALSRLEGTGEWVCYVVSGDRARLRIVEKGLEDGNFVEILSGLKPGEPVVAQRSRFLKDGVPVEVENR